VGNPADDIVGFFAFEQYGKTNLPTLAILSIKYEGRRRVQRLTQENHSGTLRHEETWLDFENAFELCNCIDLVPSLLRLHSANENGLSIRYYRLKRQPSLD
jgi:hypothetical protein